MYLLVTKTGKYWRYDYHYLKKRKTLALGGYPQVTLKETRERHHQARKKVTDGIDPGHLRKINKIAKFEAAENSFGKFAWEWFSRQNWTEGHARTVRGRLDNDIMPWLSDMPKDRQIRNNNLLCHHVSNHFHIIQ